MLGDKFITLDGFRIPNPPEGLQENFENIENIGTAESGRELVMVTRLLKRSWSLALVVSDAWRSRLLEIGRKNSVDMIYRGETIAVRARVTGCKMYKGSEYSKESDGYYDITLDITEL